MRVRLFWKILWGFWVTWLLTTVVTLATLFAFVPQTRVILNTRQVVAQAQRQRERELTAVLQSGGEQTLGRVEALMTPQQRADIRIVGSGQSRKVVFAHPPPPLPWPFSWTWIFQLIASLIFSAALAAYMTRPIDRLRVGFHDLARGALGTRLGPGMGRRRDEIADLARDFDAMAERLQQLIASRDRLLHDVSHELRSPLARMTVAVGLARQNPERAPEALERIEADGARLNAIVGDLLSLSRAEAGAPREDVYFDVAAMLEVICADARFEAEPKQVSVELTVDEALADPVRAPLVSGAPELIRRALENVVRNALRYSPAGSELKVAARLKDGRIVVEVRDQGPGVEPALRARMFDPFVKGSDDNGGAGLGLAIASRALAAHAGRIEAVEPDGGGLLIRITLPTSRDGLAGPRAGEG
jgi:two-component system OmpR family sensor kinase